MGDLFDLTGRTALVTGGGSGIGLALARGLARHGAAVIVNGRDAAKAEAAAEGLRAEGVSAPISIETTLTAVAAAAIDAGADMINDVAGGEESPDMIELAASRGGGVIIMHRRFDPTR